MARRKLYGMKGLNRMLRELPAAAKAELTIAAGKIASDGARLAQGKAYRRGGAYRIVAHTIKGGKGQRPRIYAGGTRLIAGRSKRPDRDRQRIGEVLWGSEWGGRRSGRTRQFDSWNAQGYAIFPGIAETKPRERYGKALEDAARKAG